MKDIVSSIDAVSEVVSTLLTLTIVLGVVAAVLLWGLPYIEEKEMLSEFQTVAGGFDVMYDTISSMIIHGYGSNGINKIVNTNELSSLNVGTQNSKLIFIFSNASQNRYNFSVSGLNDEDDSFTIEGKDAEFTLHRVKIYWLDPAKNKSLYNFEIPPYKRVHKDTSCVQPFKIPTLWTDGVLDRIKIYIRKRGEITSDLNVSIFNNNGSTVNIEEPLRSLQISASEIPTSYDWIECNFDDIELNSGNTYYIGLNTSGGSFGGGNYNFYEWYLDKYTPFSNVFDAKTSGDEIDWVPEPGYDFQYRINFTDNVGPNTPEIPGGIPTEIYSGNDVTITASATDKEADPVKLRIFWGDGDNSSWVDRLSGETYDFIHTYPKPGNYTLTLQAKDDATDLIYEPDNITTIDAKAGVYVPDDTYHDQEITDPSESLTEPGSWPISTGGVKLNGTLRIDLYFSGYEGEHDPFGRIWVFDLGSISYISPHDVGTQRTIFQNGGILTFGPIISNVINGPSFFEEDAAIGFRIIQINNTAIANVSGYGVFDIKLTMKNSYSREPRFYGAYHVKMQFFDPYQEMIDLWLNYYTKFHNFETYADMENAIIYTEYDPPKRLVLDSSCIVVNVAGGGI
ncbi:MAG: PKD domain-containing protein [Thermoplasmatales archaeon]|nr:PKD domain-containing protein [Thermoplasmatales archaeon]